MDLIDETGRLVGLHQLEQNKPFARLMNFIKTNVSIRFTGSLTSGYAIYLRIWNSDRETVPVSGDDLPC